MTSVRAAFICVAWCLLFSASALAHTPTLSVLNVRERVPGEFITSWERTDGIADAGAAYELLRPVFPEHCRFSPPQLDCGERGLFGRIGFDGLGELGSSGMIKIQLAGGESRLLSITAAQPHVRVTGIGHEAVTFRSFLNFVGTGVMHIWLGLDHLLFVLGLLWFANSWRPLFQTITAFTVAHSLTLGAATLGFQVLPIAPVEATIALSIAFVAVEIAREVRTGQASVTRRRPWAVAFAFGLLHGFGFASALGGAGDPEERATHRASRVQRGGGAGTDRLRRRPPGAASGVAPTARSLGNQAADGGLLRDGHRRDVLVLRAVRGVLAGSLAVWRHPVARFVVTRGHAAP